MGSFFRESFFPSRRSHSPRRRKPVRRRITTIQAAQLSSCFRRVRRRAPRGCRTTTPMYGAERVWRGWTFAIHGSAFAQFLYEPGDRPSHRRARAAPGQQRQLGHADGAAAGRRRAASGCARWRAWSPGRCRTAAYINLLATGEMCEGDTIHDRQHPHDLFMELAADYDRPLARLVALAGLWRTRRGARARSGRIPASRLGDAESDCADRAPLARLDAHHVRARHRRHLRPAMEAGDVGLQRPRARRGPLRTSISGRSIRSRGGFILLPSDASRAAGIGRPPRRSRSGVPAAATDRRQSRDGVRHLSPPARIGRTVGVDLRVRAELVPPRRCRAACSTP